MPRRRQALILMMISVFGGLVVYVRLSGYGLGQLVFTGSTDAAEDLKQRMHTTTSPPVQLDPFVKQLLDDPVFHNSSVFSGNSTTHRPPQELLNILDRIESRPWTFNKRAVEKLRRELEVYTHTRDLLVLTQQNTPPNSSIRYAHSRYKTFYIPEKLQKYQPEEMPFANAHYNQCSIVGNSGILVNSECGNNINQADFVIRFNFPPVLQRFQKDSGIRTHLFTCNAGIIDTKFGYFGDLVGKTRWVRTFKNYVLVYKYGRSSILTFPFMIPGEHQMKLLDFQRILRDQNVENRVFLNHPDHRRKTTEFWAKRGMVERSLTSGFYVINAALSFCDQVKVYGFWPFDRDRWGRALEYHYGVRPRDKGPDNPWHRMDREFYKLVELYAAGIIQLVTKPCS